MPVVRFRPGTCAAAFNRSRGLDIRGCDPETRCSGPIFRVCDNLASRAASAARTPNHSFATPIFKQLEDGAKTG